MSGNTTGDLRLALPKGRMQAAVFELMAESGVPVRATDRDYRPRLHLPGFDAKLLKPQNIVEMLHAGSRDLGFTGADQVAELDGELIELLDTGLDQVRLVAAAPAALLRDGRLPRRPIVVASEYERLTSRWIEERGCGDSFVHSFGATEVFPPEDADCIVDLAASGATLRANGLCIVDELMRSSTRLFTSERALADPARRERIERFVLLLRSVLDARSRVMIELNVPAAGLSSIVDRLPALRQATVSQLHDGAGFAVKAAVPRDSLPELIPDLKARGGSDLIVTDIARLVV